MWVESRLRAVSFFSYRIPCIYYSLRSLVFIKKWGAAKTAGTEKKEKERDCGGILIFLICRLCRARRCDLWRVANATGFGLLATNFSLLVDSLATAISSYYFILFSFHFLRSMTEWMNVNCKPRGMHSQCNFLSVSCTKPFKHAFTIITEISYIHV